MGKGRDEKENKNCDGGDVDAMVGKHVHSFIRLFWKKDAITFPFPSFLSHYLYFSQSVCVDACWCRPTKKCTYPGIHMLNFCIISKKRMRRNATFFGENNNKFLRRKKNVLRRWTELLAWWVRLGRREYLLWHLIHLVATKMTQNEGKKVDTWVLCDLLWSGQFQFERSPHWRHTG